MKFSIIAAIIIFCIASIYAIYPHNIYGLGYKKYVSRYNSGYGGLGYNSDYGYKSPYGYYGRFGFRAPNKYDYGRAVFGARSGYYA